MGAIAGLLCAFYFRKKGLQKEEFIWEEDSEEDEGIPWSAAAEAEEDMESKVNSDIIVHYTYKEQKKE